MSNPFLKALLACILFFGVYADVSAQEVPVLNLKRDITTSQVQQFYQMDVTGDGIDEIVYFREKSDIGFCVSVVNVSDFKYLMPNLPVRSQQCTNDTNVGITKLFVQTPEHPSYLGFTTTIENERIDVHFLNKAMQTVHEVTIYEGYKDLKYPIPIIDLIGPRLCDWDGDGQVDLILGLNRGVEIKPRALLGIDIQSGEKTFQYDVAPMVTAVALGDINRDGAEEIFFSTAGASDGPVFGPLARDSSYLALYRPNGKVDILWRYAGESSYVEFITEDITGDGYEDILAFGYCNVEPATRPSELIWIDGRDFRVGGVLRGEGDFRNITVGHAGGQTALYNSDLVDGLAQYRFDPEKRQWVFHRQKDLNKPLFPVLTDDINGDGDDELFYVNRESSQVEIYDSAFHCLASFPVSAGTNYAKIEPVRQSPPGERHYLVLDQGKQFFRLRIPLTELFPPPSSWMRIPVSFWGLPFVLMALCVYALWKRSTLTGPSTVDKSGQIALLRVDRRGVVQKVNHQLMTLFDLDGNAVLHRPLEAVLPDPASKSISEMVSRFQNGHRDYALETLQLHDGHTQKDLVFECFRIHHRGQFYWTEMLILDGSEANQAERLKAWAAMAQRVVHKTKTPLGTILLALQRLQRTYRKGCRDHAAELDRHLEPALAQIARVRDQVNLFVKFSRVNEHQMAHKDLTHVIKDLVDQYRESMPRGVTLSSQWEAESLPVCMDESQFREAVINHLDNAVTAVKGEGNIVISTALESHPLADWGRRGVAVLEIRDDGCGMAPDGMAQLFNPGYTTHEHGSGMGMVISKSIVEALGGQIDVHSQEGLGTTITIRLPIAEMKTHEN